MTSAKEAKIPACLLVTQNLSAMPVKNGLTEDDARCVEAAYVAKVNAKVVCNP